MPSLFQRVVVWALAALLCALITTGYRKKLPFEELRNKELPKMMLTHRPWYSGKRGTPLSHFYNEVRKDSFSR